MNTRQVIQDFRVLLAVPVAKGGASGCGAIRARVIKTIQLFIAILVCGCTSSFAGGFKVLHAFSESPGHTNWDGANPYIAGLIISSNTLYGTAYFGGTNGSGTLFSLDTDGNDFSVLHTFSDSSQPTYTNWDGEYPQGGLVFVDDVLYGAAVNGGTILGGYGTLFSLSDDGSGFNTLHSLDSLLDGRNPVGPLVSSGNRLYGVAQNGGGSDRGTIFSVSNDGTDFAVLHSLTNGEGDLPFAGLLLSGDTLFGTTDYGGTNGTIGGGTVFSLKTNGTDFAVLHHFSRPVSPSFTNYEGKGLDAALVRSGDTLYGTATGGGAYRNGTLFSIKTNGADFVVLHTFTGGFDGGAPLGITLAGGVIYGVAEFGGANDSGTIYSINTDGSNFSVLFAFESYSGGSFTNSSGTDPEGPMVLSGPSLYGTAQYGGIHGSGTVFRFDIAPTISSVSAQGSNLVISAKRGVAAVRYCLLTSEDLSLPLDQWAAVATNHLTAGGDFSMVVSNAIRPEVTRKFCVIQSD